MDAELNDLEALLLEYEADFDPSDPKHNESTVSPVSVLDQAGDIRSKAMDVDVDNLALMMAASTGGDSTDSMMKPKPMLNTTGDITELIEDILDRTHEGNRDLIERTVRISSYAVCKTALLRTLEIQATGGMLVNDGSRRRSAGGVFMELVTEKVGKEVLKPVYNANRKVVQALQKEARAAVKRRKQMESNQQQKRRRMAAREQ
jgi:hypothetical protein